LSDVIIHSIFIAHTYFNTVGEGVDGPRVLAGQLAHCRKTAGGRYDDVLD
jgi:hypothetical protein